MDTGSLLTSSVASSFTYRDFYLLRPNAVLDADRVRVVATYAPTTGTLTPDRTWTNAPAAAEAYELHGLIEPYTTLKGLINNALKRCWVSVEASFTPTPLQTRHGLCAQFNPPTGLVPWLRDEAQVRQVGMLTAGQSRELWDPFRQIVYGYPSIDGEEFWLNHPSRTFNSTDTVYLNTMARAYDVCLDSTNQNAGFRAVGLSVEADQAVPPVEWVAAGVLVEAWRQMAHLLEPGANQRLIRDAAGAAAWFSTETALHCRLPRLTFRRMEWFGPSPAGSWPY